MADAMKLVPVEPTEAMLDEACYFWGPWLDDEKTQRAGRHSDDPEVRERAKAVWQQMLAASPPAREEAPAEGAGDNAEHWRERALSAEASMLALRRIEDAKVFCEIETSDIWSVHVRGPDETVAAKSYADAVSYCDKLNAECPDARAVPILSPHKGSPVVLSAYDVACYEYPDATGAPLRDAFALGAMYASTNLRNRTSEPEAGAVETLGPSADFWSNVITHPAPATADKLRGIIDAATNAALPPVCDVTGNGTKERASIQVEIANRIIAALNEQPQ